MGKRGKEHITVMFVCLFSPNWGLEFYYSISRSAEM